jgi:hypothetical protein
VKAKVISMLAFEKPDIFHHAGIKELAFLLLDNGNAEL